MELNEALLHLATKVRVGLAYHDRYEIAEAIEDIAREAIQPLANERDELHAALTYMVRIAEDQGWTDVFLSLPRAVLAKYKRT